MKKPLFLSTLLTAAALSVPAFATDYTFSKDSIPSADGITAGGDGSQDNPYYITACGSGNRVSITVSGDNSIFTASGTTVYLGSDTQSFGTAEINMYFADAVTAACDIVIGAAGVYITNGSSGNVHTFSGKISGTGSWTVTTNDVTQHYVFTGDLSGWTGNFTIDTPEDADYVYYGNGGTAATNTNISGNGGSISVDYGEVRYNYTGYAEETSASALTVTNSSIEGHKVTFTGSVNYEVSSTITGWDAADGSKSISGSTLTISNTGTTTFSGSVSNFDIVTVGASSTLAVGSTGSLDLSNTTVNISSTIQNSGSITLNESTIFALGNMDYTGDWTSTNGATYTLVSGSGKIYIGTDELTSSNVSSLTISNVSSSVEISNATFSYVDGTLSVTVKGTTAPLGSAASNPYTGSISGFDIWDSTWGAGSTIYITNVTGGYFGTGNNDYTCVADIVIGYDAKDATAKNGITLDDGYSSASFTFTGSISGEGNWTFNKSGVAQHYTFTGDLSGYSGNIDYSGANSGTTFNFGNGGKAATDTDVSGTGSIVVNGTLNYNYSEYADGSSEAITIGNSSLTANTIKFDGSVNYEVKNITVAEGSSTQLTKSTAVTLTVSLTDLVLGDGATFTLYADTHPTSSVGGLSIGTVTIAEGATSAAMKTSHWETYVGIANLVGKDVTLTLDSSSDSDSGATIFELGTSGNTESTSQFTGKIVLSDDASAGSSGTGHRAASLVISEKNIAAGAVIEFGTETVSQYSLSLGVNASTVEIAGLVSASEHTGGDIIYSGTLDMGVSPGDGGASLIDYKSDANKENFTHVGTSRNTLVINVAENTEYSFSGVFLDMLNIEKTGAGTQSITFQKSQYGSTGYYFDGSIAVTEGTLNLSGVETNSSGITVAADATLSISNHITLVATSDITSVTSTISGTLSIAEGGQLDLTGTVTINSAISNAGTITIADGTSITVGVEVQTGEYNSKNYDYYTLIDGSNGSGSVTLGESVTFVINGAEITLSEIATLADGDTDWKGYISGGSLYIYAEAQTTAETADPLYWAGTEGNSTWSTSDTNTPWSATADGDAGYYFAEGASVTFGPNTEGSLSTTIVLGEDITADTVNITGSGYTLTASDTTNGNTLTATSIVLDDEDSATEHKFTIDTGVKVTAGTLTETAGQLDLVVNGELNVTTMTVSTTKDDESISGSGKLSVGTLEYSSDHGVSLTISVAEATFGSITEQSSGTESNGSLRHLIFGNGTSTTTATVTSMEIKGLSEVQVAKDSTLTITNLVDSSGWNTTISGDGSIKIGSMTVSGSATNATLNISIANFESGAITFSGTVALTISSTSFKADSIVFSGGNNLDSGAGHINISSGAKATIGTIESSNMHTITIADGGELTTGEIYRSGSTLNLEVNGTMTVAQLSGYGEEGETTSGMIYFGKSTDNGTGMAQTISGSGTANVYGIEANLGGGSLTISVTNLNIGAGGITRYGSGNGAVTINGTTVGLYNTNTSEISADMTIGSNGATFNPGSGESITLSGAITGNGLVAKTGDGELAFTGTGSTLTNGLTVSAGTVSVAENASLTLGGTVTLASAISNSGSITIADSTSFVIDGIEMGTNGGEGNRNYYIVIAGGDGASLSGTISIDNFSLTDGDLSNWSVYTDSGYLVIYGEAQTTAGQQGENLTWAGTDSAFTWNTNSENAIWNDTETGASGYYFTDGNNVTFGAEGAYTTVAVDGEVAPGSITVNSAYTFAIGEEASVTTGSLTYGNDGSLTLTGKGTFIFNGETTSTDFTISTSSEFTGTLEVAKGTLDLAKVSLGTSTKLVIDAIGDPETNGAYTTSSSNAILFSEGNTTLANDLTISGTSGGVILRSAGQEITLSGSVTGDEGTTLQLNGNGTATFSGAVSLDNYINYQGATIFTNETTLGSLSIYKTDGNAGDVTFTGSAAQATVTALTVHSTTGTGTATLTVSDGASLEVGTMTIDHDLAITIDSAAMSITGTVTQTSGTTTEVTISNGGTLSLGSDVSLNVAAMEIILGTENLSSSGVYVITGDTGSSLSVATDAAIKITVDSALASLLETEGTYTFNIYEGLSLSTDVFDIDDILGYTGVSDVTWSNGVLTVVVGSGAIPEPELFSIFFGLGAIGLVATRRRRRVA